MLISQKKNFNDISLDQTKTIYDVWLNVTEILLLILLEKLWNFCLCLFWMMEQPELEQPLNCMSFPFSGCQISDM